MLKPYSFVFDGCTYTFQTVPQINEFKSGIAGRKVFEDREICTARGPSMGPPKQENADAITQDWLDYKDGFGRMDNPHSTFRNHYEKWKAGEGSGVKGTSLENLPDLTPAMIQTLEASKIETLEQLAQMDPSNLAKAIGPEARTIVEKAKAIISPVNQDVMALREQAAKQASALEAANLQMDELRKQLAAMQAKSGKGGKAKATEEAETA